MFYPNRILQDVELMFRNLKITDDYFHSVRDCTIKYPIIDQRYTKDKQQIIIAATGATKSDFTINLKDDILYISRISNSEDLDETNDYKYVKHNISRKPFEVAFKVPNIWDSDNLTVVLELGELIITIPIKEELKPKNIEFVIS